VYVPHRFTWAHEVVTDTNSHADGYFQVDSITELPLILETLKHQ
jgi:hypothetical protein